MAARCCWAHPLPRRKAPAPPPLFTPPGQALTGEPAFNSIKQYFLNSEFSDCAQGSWPTCQVENRYEHGPQLQFEYHRCTPVSGSDINSYGSYSVTGAAAHPDGSWQVEYVVDAYGTQSFYSWDVAADGTVVGRYWAPGHAPPSPPDQNLGPLSYKQPTDCGA